MCKDVNGLKTDLPGEKIMRKKEEKREETKKPLLPKNLNTILPMHLVIQFSKYSQSHNTSDLFSAN